MGQIPRLQFHIFLKVFFLFLTFDPANPVLYWKVECIVCFMISCENKKNIIQELLFYKNISEKIHIYHHCHVYVHNIFS